MITKATLLSWSAKRGLSGGESRLLGQHRKPKDRSVDVYSRDQLAPALRSLQPQVQRLLHEVKDALFQPDASRSRYIAYTEEKMAAFFGPVPTQCASDDEADNAHDAGQPPASVTQQSVQSAAADLRAHHLEVTLKATICRLSLWCLREISGCVQCVCVAAALLSRSTRFVPSLPPSSKRCFRVR
eukprot:100599-Amphidinium_carterae.1